MFQANRNGWKRLAASLLLLPGLTAVGAEMLHLLGTAQAQERVAAPADSDKTEIAEKQMKLARAAFDKGDYARAKELAEAVKKMNVGMPFWDDSPDQLLADIQKMTGSKGNSALKPTDDDPRKLVKDAKAALELGKLDVAQDRARQAEANGRNTSWGLFEDTPADILKAVAKARSKRDRAESEKLMSQARGLYEKRSASEEVRATSLEKARSLCLQAAQLHGPYSMWDFGDKPQSLIKEIDLARAKLKITARKSEPSKTEPSKTDTAFKPKSEPTADSKDKPLFVDPDARPVGYNPTKPEDDGFKNFPIVSKQSVDLTLKLPASDEGQRMILPPDMPNPMGSMPDPRVAKSSGKAQAVQMMQAASAQHKGGKYVEARVLLIEAQKLNAPFGADEETPEMALQSLMASAQNHITKLCREAHETMVKKTAKDVADAERMLIEANAIATGLELDRWAIGEHQATLKSIKNQTAVAATMKPLEFDPPPLTLPIEPKVAVQNPPPLEIPGDPRVSVQTPPLVLPADPKLSVQIPPSLVLPAEAVSDPRVAVQMPATNQGMELLRQAHNELRKNELENARQIVKQVLNGPFTCKAEAQDLLRTIDAEETILRKHTAKRAYDRGTEAYQSKNYQLALSIFKQIEPSLLPPQQKKSLMEMTAVAVKVIEKPGVMLVGGPNSPTELPPPGVADNLLKQEEAMRELQFQKLRSEGLQLEANATARFGKGDTDAALADLNAFATRVKASNLDQAKIALLVRPIESRVERLKVLKHQQDFLTKEAKDLRKFRDQASQESLQIAHKKEEVARLMKEYKRLMAENNFQEAGKVALMARELDPEDPVAQAAMQISRMAYRKGQWEESRSQNEEMVYRGIDDAMRLGKAYVGGDDPVKFDKDTFNRIKNRQDTSGGFSSLRPRSEAEKKIESMLNNKSVSFSFKNTPLDEVVGYLQTYTGINFDIDTKAMSNDNIDPKAPITSTLNNITLKSALEIVLMKANLRFVVDKDVVRVTTQKGARAQMTRRTIPVADLVIPVQNYNPSAVSNLDAMLERSMNNGFNPGGYGGPGANTPMQPLKGLNGNTAQIVGNGSRGGNITNQQISTNGVPEVSKGNSTGTIEETLIRLITTSVHPDTWEAMGGPGRVEYYPLGMALVINQTPDVIEEVIKLLESLRQLQDLEIAIEVRMITLAETFYERMGLDFSMNLNTHNANTQLNLANGTATGTNIFQNLQNIKNAGGKVVGLQVPGTPTTDLNLPISSSSFGMAIPPFGNYPNAPGLDGGLSVGLAFLSDIQVQMFLDAAQGDRRTNVMQAPKLTMFNGQSANIRIQDQQFFLTGVTVTPVNGVLVFTPQNQPFPLGVTMFMQPVVSGDRRFVRLNIQQTMTNLASATVPLFPITTIVTPQFDGGGQGVPVPFTQYIQQPSFTTITVQTTVVVPDGGTVLLGGLKTLSEGRNEFGPPVISKIPYLNRLFRNVGYGRDAQSLMMMVTPRIIINREEQERQTGVIEGPGGTDQ